MTTTDPRVVRTRQRALDAGARLLLETGIDAVTHAQVAEVAGVGRRTLYRHWPDRRSLVRDVLSLTRAPEPVPGEDVSTSVSAHVVAMDAALNDGPLAYILSALYERAVHDEEFEQLRSELAESGCAHLVGILTAAVADGSLPPDTDVDATAGLLEGSVLHAAVVTRRRPSRDRLLEVVRAVLASPPRTVRQVARRPRQASASGSSKR